MLFLLNPAVSIKIYSPLSFLKFVSIASLVVPGISLTILLFSPIILLTKEDFPTFGFPIKATFVINPSSSFSFCLGKCSYISSKTSPIPIAFDAEIGCGSPIPKL